jgi:IS30 family transposase
MIHKVSNTYDYKSEPADVENEINNRLARKFGYLTPNEVFLNRG